MITIDASRCTGCGACLAICPSGALFLRDGRVGLDQGLCRSCGLCLDTCPSGAIGSLAPVPVPPEPVAAARADEVVTVSHVNRPLLWRERLLPSVGAVAVFAVRQVLPLLLEAMAGGTARRGTVGGSGQSLGPAGGRRHRLRGRGA